MLPDPGIVLVHLRTSLFQNGDPTLTVRIGDGRCGTRETGTRGEDGAGRPRAGETAPPTSDDAATADAEPERERK